MLIISSLLLLGTVLGAAAPEFSADRAKAFLESTVLTMTPLSWPRQWRSLARGALTLVLNDSGDWGALVSNVESKLPGTVASLNLAWLTEHVYAVGDAILSASQSAALPSLVVSKDGIMTEMELETWLSNQLHATSRHSVDGALARACARANVKRAFRLVEAPPTNDIKAAIVDSMIQAVYWLAWSFHGRVPSNVAQAVEALLADIGKMTRSDNKLPASFLKNCQLEKKYAALLDALSQFLANSANVVAFPMLPFHQDRRFLIAALGGSIVLLVLNIWLFVWPPGRKPKSQ